MVICAPNIFILQNQHIDTKLQHSDSNFLLIFQACCLLDMVCSENGGRSHTLQSLSFFLWNLGNEHFLKMFASMFHA